ncbi:AbrB family transcriptional regulator [Rhizobium lemnae]|uniref:AbrB family transcriptional regulator n=1 Tax=Rhizobium lemnae TaxID=1214924 RepID=A0ABV8EAV3_9HYPH|nr:AbrB family transcriptional regulator [Rhizobium lemnae]MCJ8506469.1 AbrB family transcriptional regulator [Rhizobium lemnae]
MFSQDIWPVAITAALGLMGALIASALSLPAPYLIGPAALVTLGSLTGLDLQVPHLVRNVAFLSVGLSMGSGVTPEVLSAAQAWPLSFITLAAMSLALLLIVYAVLKAVFRYDPMTSMLAACPGHLSYVLALAAGVRSDLVSVGVIQSVRVLALTLLVPLFVEMSAPIGTPMPVASTTITPLALSMMGAVGFLLGRGLDRLRVPAALLIGGMIVSSAAHLTHVVEGGIPIWLQVPVYVALGSMIGSRFAGVSLSDLRSACMAGLTATIIAGVISVAVAIGVSRLLGVPLPAALIAFAPGGLETMAAMAIILHADPAYVGTHHIVRLIFLSFLMPAMIAWVRKR